MKSAGIIDLSSIKKLDKISEDEYKDRLSELQFEILKYQIRFLEDKIPVVLVFEGWDAAGKGGVIKRITEKLDPRMYDVHPIGPPTPTELKHHYMRRFWIRLPMYGELGIFDRSWYGRVLVERVEQLCAKHEWEQAYEEINDFEKKLANNGFLVVKFFLHITKDEQYKRLKDRETHTYKRWKLSDDDWRNRDKWDDYEVAINDLLEKTTTDVAPWHVIHFEQKKAGRIKVMEIMLESYKKYYKKHHGKRGE
ncbi:polyphosphate kinase 2 family protein [Desulfuribacillus alkaliarsenatis]|uniref:UDP-galactose-lipid carrier transferase n=1 Tax=Desulfuribacillus alkaliarsenatis TaxID=766136 RepID=A0A1E5G0S4_9FIRM|nr:UDP-galactose-lipid carrier transferase [Desulfuribacillus alkaliarsenatis]OEF96505.1 UDP-galactose-lipid carrier transferase [Desulfuribacillus alkaliarsenatis]